MRYNKSSLSSSSSVIQFFEGSKPDHTKSWLYGLCSLSYLGAMVSSNSALLYVNYPTQVSPLLFLHLSRLFCSVGAVIPDTFPFFSCARCWENPANQFQVNVTTSQFVTFFTV